MRSIKVKYHTQIKQKWLINKLYVFEAIRDLDEAIDMICEKLDDEEQKDPFAEDLCPYFGILWPSAEALATFISENPLLFQDKSVLELGCGLGFPSMVATHVGAQVLATDFHPDVEEYFQRNCRHSNIDCRYQRLNWRDSTEVVGLFDVVMGSDILYESKHPREVAQGLIRFLKPGGKIILSDPGRSYLQQFVTAMKFEGLKEELTIQSVGDKDHFIFLFNQ